MTPTRTPMDELVVALRGSIARDAAQAPTDSATVARLKALEQADADEQLLTCQDDAEREVTLRRWLNCLAVAS